MDRSATSKNANNVSQQPMTQEQTKEPQYDRCMELYRNPGPAVLGPMMNQVWFDDPRRLGIVLARYKFVAKMLSGKARVLEIGVGDGWASRVVKQEVGTLVGID